MMGESGSAYHKTLRAVSSWVCQIVLQWDARWFKLHAMSQLPSCSVSWWNATMFINHTVTVVAKDWIVNILDQHLQPSDLLSYVHPILFMIARNGTAVAKEFIVYTSVSFCTSCKINQNRSWRQKYLDPLIKNVTISMESWLNSTGIIYIFNT